MNETSTCTICERRTKYQTTAVDHLDGDAVTVEQWCGYHAPHQCKTEKVPLTVRRTFTGMGGYHPRDTSTTYEKLGGGS